MLPDLVTRDELYARLRERLPGRAAAADARSIARCCCGAPRTRAHGAGAEPPFNLRPGLIGEILALYDELRRRHKTVADFDRLMTGTLESSAPYDRGAARLLAQTAFLTATFEAFEQALADVAGVDEHGDPRAGARVAAAALSAAGRHGRRSGRRIARGLWTADFDLFARMPGVDAIDVVATEALLESGYYQRLHDSLLPGIEDVRASRLAAPASAPARCWSCRTPDAAAPSCGAVVRLPRP